MKRWAALAVLFFGVLPALACNLPTAAVSTPDVKQVVEMTLDALRQVTPANAPVEQTPVPGEPAAEAATPLRPAATPLPPLPIVTVHAPTTVPTLDENTFQYITQPGDTLASLALRFGMPVEQIPNPQNAAPQMLLPAGQALALPNLLSAGAEAGNTANPGALLPDDEIVYSPTAADFSVAEYIQQSGGFLSSYSEPSESEVLSGTQIIQRVANETSINPRLLLAVLEYRSHWVLGSPAENSSQPYPIGFYAGDYKGLYKEMILVARQLTIGYYGWRTGKVSSLEFANGSKQRIHPTVNAGTAALQYLFSKLYGPADWQSELYSPARFIAFYAIMFGDPWDRSARFGPQLPDGLAQPALELPFPSGQTWTLTGGPHVAWGVGSSWGGLDFAPASVEAGCGVSRFWATAAAEGTVVRAEDGEVVLDLDGDGSEQTGWVLLYLHIAKADRVAAGKHLKMDDVVGHPSCEGGFSTGTHLHLARKYNGEWIEADGPLPFVLSGWTAKAGDRQYTGGLVKNDQLVTSRIEGTRTSIITR